MKKFKLLFDKYGKFVFYGLLIIVTFIFYEKLFILGMLALFGGIWGYIHDKKNKTVFDFRLGFILGIFVARHYDFVYAVVFYLIVAVIPNLLAGGRIDGPTLVFHMLYIILFFAVTLFPHANIFLLGLIMILTDGIFGIFINITLGVPQFISILSACVAVTMRIIYLLTIGRLIEFVFAIV